MEQNIINWTEESRWALDIQTPGLRRSDDTCKYVDGGRAETAGNVAVKNLYDPEECTAIQLWKGRRSMPRVFHRKRRPQYENTWHSWVKKSHQENDIDKNRISGSFSLSAAPFRFRREWVQNVIFLFHFSELEINECENKNTYRKFRTI